MEQDKTSACGSDLAQALARIEAKLDILIVALAAEDDQEEPSFTLDGEVVGGARDQSSPL